MGLQCFGVDRDSSFGIATRYELDGPKIESREALDFSHSSRATLGPSQYLVEWVTGRCRG